MKDLKFSDPIYYSKSEIGFWIENINQGPEKQHVIYQDSHAPEKNVRFFDVIISFDLVHCMFSRKPNSGFSRYFYTTNQIVSFSMEQK